MAEINLPEGAAASTPPAGVVALYAKSDGKLYSKDDAGTETELGASGSGSGDVVGPASSVDSEIALFDSTTGKLLKRATGSGIAKITSGVLGTASAGTDYVAPGTATNFTLPQRSALLTDNDGSFDLSAKQNFKCTPTAGATLTFTNQADGLSGSVVLVNGSNYAIAAHANTKISATALTRISASGTYRVDYISDGTFCYCTASENLA